MLADNAIVPSLCVSYFIFADTSLESVENFTLKFKLCCRSVAYESIGPGSV